VAFGFAVEGFGSHGVEATGTVEVRIESMRWAKEAYDPSTHGGNEMQGFVLGPTEGKVYELQSGNVRVTGLPEQTGIGSFSIESFPPGFASPLHVHHRDAGVFFVLEGIMRIRCGDMESVAGPGSTVFLPAGVPHAFRVEGDAAARWFNVQAPHGDFVLQTIARVDGGAFPETAAGKPAVEPVGPPPF